jgi:hypothetical protein
VEAEGEPKEEGKVEADGRTEVDGRAVEVEGREKDHETTGRTLPLLRDWSRETREHNRT